MTDSARELTAAVDYVRRQFNAWHQAGKITNLQLAAIRPAYDRWIEEIDPALDYTDALPAAEVCLEELEDIEWERRLLVFLQQEIRRHAVQQRLTPGQVQSLTHDVQTRIGVVQTRLASRETTKVGAAPMAESGNGAADDAKRRTLVEYLLDPRSLQALMITGGALLVLGLVVWLWTKGVFDNPVVVASCLGAANIGLLAGGAAMVRFSRYQTAGRAITLLACLVLPLNLWFYDAQGLITLKVTA